MEFESRQYVIFSTSEIDKIDFNEVLETSSETMRLSVDGSLTFVKWEGEVPPCVESLTTKGEYLTHSEMLIELDSEVWSSSLSANSSAS